MRVFIMVASCSAYNCQERYVKGGDITFHSFPKNEELKKKWVLLTRRQNFIPTQASKLCSKHFTSDCFDNDSQCQSTTIRKKTKLKQDAVPSIFNFPRFVNTLKNKRKLLQRQESPPAGQERGWPPLNKEHSKVWLINFRKDDWKSSQLSQTCPQHLTASNFIFCPDRNVKRPTTENVSAVFNFPALLSDQTVQQDPSKEIPPPPDKVKEEKHKSKANAVGLGYLGDICGNTRMDRVSDEWVLKECSLKGNQIVQCGTSVLRWFGHVERMSVDRVMKEIYEAIWTVSCLPKKGTA
uniref:THAP-type domain-containing protein n=1 Tax=Timema douglasi TaxID=61478 RepID=A0A7R8VWK0_TIMDO|nr:unnamed protein product [Timema douglasi]